MIGKRIASVTLAICFGVIAQSARSQQKVVDTEGHSWWQHAVFYEVYPRSFADSGSRHSFLPLRWTLATTSPTTRPSIQCTAR